MSVGPGRDGCRISSSLTRWFVPCLNSCNGDGSRNSRHGPSTLLTTRAFLPTTSGHVARPFSILRSGRHARGRARRSTGTCRRRSRGRARSSMKRPTTSVRPEKMIEGAVHRAEERPRWRCVVSAAPPTARTPLVHPAVVARLSWQYSCVIIAGRDSLCRVRCRSLRRFAVTSSMAEAMPAPFS